MRTMHRRVSLRKRNRGEEHGFTLVELLIVVVIIGILAAIFLPKIAQAIETAKQGRTLAHMNNTRGALGQYFIDHGEDAWSYFPWGMRQIAHYYPAGTLMGCGTHGGKHWYMEQIPYEEVGDGGAAGNSIADWCTSGSAHTWHLMRGVASVDDGQPTTNKGGWNWCVPNGEFAINDAPSGTVWIDENVMMFSGKEACDN